MSKTNFRLFCVFWALVYLVYLIKHPKTHVLHYSHLRGDFWCTRKVPFSKRQKKAHFNQRKTIFFPFRKLFFFSTNHEYKKKQKIFIKHQSCLGLGMAAQARPSPHERMISHKWCSQKFEINSDFHKNMKKYFQQKGSQTLTKSKINKKFFLIAHEMFSDSEHEYSTKLMNLPGAAFFQEQWKTRSQENFTVFEVKSIYFSSSISRRIQNTILRI